MAFENRVKIINFLILGIFILLALALFNFQAIRGRAFRQQSDKNCIRLLPQYGARGKILDRHRDLLVDSYLSFDAMILPQEANQLDRTLREVAEVLGQEEGRLRKNYKSEYLAPFMPVVIARDIEAKKAIALEELKFDFPGIIIQSRPQRAYPFGSLACHLIGYLNEIDRWRLTKLEDYGYKTKDIVGYSGLEEAYDYYLRQEDGATSVEVDHRGRFVRVLGYRPPENGKDVQLTLDLKLQKISAEALGERKGTVIIMEPASGEILAMVSNPGYNPAVFVKKNNQAIADLFRDSNSPLLNRATSGQYPPGSVFKLVVATAGLETKKINLGTTFLCTGGLNIGRRRFNCWDTHNLQDLLSGIAHSCDVFFYHTGLLVGAQVIHDYALKFGFGRPSGVDLPSEAAGFLPDPLWKSVYRRLQWFNGDTANFAIGQGDLLVTPLQVCRMVSVFANRGFLVRPYLVKAIAAEDISGYQKRVVRIDVPEKILNYVSQGMRKVVSDPKGTASVLADLPVAVAGKTGTSQVSRGQPHGWFAGFFPYGQPKYVICVFLEHGGAGYYACMVTKEIISRMIQEKLI